MSFDVDPAFKKSGSKSRARRKKKRRNRIILLSSLGLGLIALSVTGFLLWPQSSEYPVADSNDTPALDAPVEGGDGSEDGFAMVQAESSASMAASIAEAAFIDLPRDPMILNFDQSTSATRQTMSGSADLDDARIGFPDANRLTMIVDDLVQAEAHLVTTIPSTREDFALFQAKRSQGIEAMHTAHEEDVAQEEVSENRGELVSVDSSEGSWGELIGGEAGGSEDGADNAVYVETVIENTTSVAFLRHQAQVRKLYTDIVTVLQIERSLSEVLTSNGFEADTAALIVKAAERDIGAVSNLPIASIVALRITTPEGGTQQLQQMSLYSPDAYRASLARVGAGRYVVSGDPWYAEDLLAGGRNLQAQSSGSTENVRLLDGLYSAGIRNELSTTMVGEIIVAMAQLYDLDRIAAEDDKITILHANNPGAAGKGLGAILYASIERSSGDMTCYVAPKPGGDGFACINQRGGGGGASGGLGGGLMVPVSGTRTSSFGPRMHPVLKQLRNHNGVDWGAPTGTPIHAAAAGKISRAAVSQSYGNVVYIDHGQGVETRYAHMDRFAPASKLGARVQAGELIGYVGTTGRSTGPHLHFELRVGGTAVDPITYRGGAGGGGAGSGGGGGGAVEALVNKIIRVESGGNASAQNPNSSATGLGQFINSTWLRMMRTYRPDLVQSLSQAELLALRTNPELSREMVRNLARENEAFLRAKGHSISAGRLYLAHFLGPQGANIALRADPGASVLSTMGAGVVNANGFLRGWTISQLTAWSDRKMSGASGRGSSRPATPSLTADQRAYIKVIDAVLEAG